MTDFDDPNREAVGLVPIWTGAGEPPPEGGTTKRTGKHRGAKDDTAKDEPAKDS